MKLKDRIGTKNDALEKRNIKTELIYGICF